MIHAMDIFKKIMLVLPVVDWAVSNVIRIRNARRARRESEKLAKLQKKADIAGARLAAFRVQSGMRASAMHNTGMTKRR